MKWERHVARMGPRKDVYRILVRKRGGKAPLGRPRFIYDNINLCLWEVGCGGMDWIHLAH